MSVTRPSLIRRVPCPCFQRHLLAPPPINTMCCFQVNLMHSHPAAHRERSRAVRLQLNCSSCCFSPGLKRCSANASLFLSISPSIRPSLSLSLCLPSRPGERMDFKPPWTRPPTPITLELKGRRRPHQDLNNRSRDIFRKISTHMPRIQGAASGYVTVQACNGNTRCTDRQPGVGAGGGY